MPKMIKIVLFFVTKINIRQTAIFGISTQDEL